MSALAQVIVADPPWKYNDRKSTRRDNPERAPKFGIGVERRYSAGTMTLPELCSLDVAGASHPDAYLFLWATCPRLDAAQTVMAAWGFPYTTVHSCWVKVYPQLWDRVLLGEVDLLNRAIFRGPGRYSPSNVELLLLGTRGRCWHPTTGYKPHQVVFAPHPRVPLTGKIWHSRKPEIFQDELTRWLAPHQQGYSLELFATRQRPGWRCLGHELTGTDIRQDLGQLAGQGSLL